MEIIKLEPGTAFWQKAIDFAQNCSWVAGKHFAQLLRENRFAAWEAAFAAIEDEHVIGYCTLLKEDYYPENRYSPWISSVFVDEAYRGRRVSQKLIGAAEKYAKSIGIDTVYIPSDRIGFYEKYGYEKIDTLQNYDGDYDSIFAKTLACIPERKQTADKESLRRRILSLGADVCCNK